MLVNNQKYIWPVLSLLTPSVQKTTNSITVANDTKLQATIIEKASFNHFADTVSFWCTIDTSLNLVLNTFGFILPTSISSIIWCKKRCLTNIKTVKLQSKYMGVFLKNYAVENVKVSDRKLNISFSVGLKVKKLKQRLVIITIAVMLR